MSLARYLKLCRYMADLCLGVSIRYVEALVLMVWCWRAQFSLSYR
ncbi:hypothetical protein JYU34_015093 [Plutella xylostella]|uniref:Uncharacterized protein n=1 Tax=Plutella xylostella TaxID=51655 RepID=A0ABQ7Q697_PLUXY|nr:hypothetical protein JYU34_015093 [Plutella xylostella]